MFAVKSFAWGAPESMSVVASHEQAQRFVEKWESSDLSERAASHEHFIDLCRPLGRPAQDARDRRLGKRN